MRILKYFFALASMVMFAGSDTHWAFAVLGVVCLAAIITIQQLEHEKQIMIENEWWERMY